MIARLLVIAAVVGATSASVTQCYQCTSSQCNSLTSYSADLCSTSSSATSYYCYKTVYKAGSTETIIRGCSADCSQGGGSAAYTYCCSSDNCNGAASVGSSVVPAIVLGSIALFAARK